MIGSALLVLLSAAPFVDPSSLAEIEPSPSGAAALRALDAKASVNESSGRVSLWKLSGGNSVQVLAALEAKLPGHFAAVFHDEPNPASKLRVPAGGVVVWLDANTNPERWALERAVVVKQSFGDGVLLLQSAPGAASLALAAALRTDKRVKSVMPNWWLRAVRR